MIDPPAHLDDDQRAIWARLAPDLEERGALQPSNVDTLAAYCCAVVFQRRAVELVNRSNVVIPKAAGGVQRNPALQVSTEQTALIATLGDKLGLSPFDDRKVAARNSPAAGGETRAEAIRASRQIRRRHPAADPPRPSRRSQSRRSNGVHRTG